MVGRFEENAQKFNFRNLFPEYIIAQHPEIDIARISGRMNELIPQLIGGTLVDEASAIRKQEEIARLSTPTKENR